MGTFVAEPKLEYALGKLTSFTDDVRRRGFEPAAKVLEMEEESASQFLQEELGLEEEAQVIRLVRLRFADGNPVGLHTGFFPASAGLDIELLRDELSETQSIYAVIKSKGVALIEAKETIEAMPADELEAGLLEVPAGAPLLLVRRTTYANEQIPIEYCNMVYRADRYRYRIHLST